jgi:hypothetical protein
MLAGAGRYIPEWAGKPSKYMQGRGGEASCGMVRCGSCWLLFLSEDDRRLADDRASGWAYAEKPSEPYA